MTYIAVELETVEPVESVQSGQPAPVSDEQLVAMLVERARSEVLQLTGNLEGSPFMFAPRWDKASYLNSFATGAAVFSMITPMLYSKAADAPELDEEGSRPDRRRPSDPSLPRPEAARRQPRPGGERLQEALRTRLHRWWKRLRRIPLRDNLRGRRRIAVRP